MLLSPGKGLNHRSHKLEWPQFEGDALEINGAQVLVAGQEQPKAPGAMLAQEIVGSSSLCAFRGVISQPRELLGNRGGGEPE